MAAKAPDVCERALAARIAKPSPSWALMNSAITTPVTAIVELMRTPLKKCGRAKGTRTDQKVRHGEAPHERQSRSALKSVLASPTEVEISTGKKLSTAAKVMRAS